MNRNSPRFTFDDACPWLWHCKISQNSQRRSLRSSHLPFAYWVFCKCSSTLNLSDWHCKQTECCKLYVYWLSTKIALERDMVFWHKWSFSHDRSLFDLTNFLYFHKIAKRKVSQTYTFCMVMLSMSRLPSFTWHGDHNWSKSTRLVLCPYSLHLHAKAKVEQTTLLRRTFHTMIVAGSGRRPLLHCVLFRRFLCYCRSLKAHLPRNVVWLHTFTMVKEIFHLCESTID